MSAPIRVLRISRPLHRACVAVYGDTTKRFYAPRQGLGAILNESGDIPQKITKNVTKRANSFHPSPIAASTSFAGTSQELQMLVHDMTGKTQNVQESDRPLEHFPSDSQNYDDWSKKEAQNKRDQSRKAHRPNIDPSKTSLIMFPGQGSQFVGMGQDTIGYGQAEDLFEEASALLKYDLLKMCLSGPISALSKTVHCQLAVLVTSLAAIEKLKQQTPEAIETCVGTAGFSVGEYAALVFAGVMSFEDAVKVVQVRAEAMQRSSEDVSSGMMTVFLNRHSELKTAMLAAREYCQQRCDISEPVCTIANYLYPECKVIAGHTQALDFVAQHAKTFHLRRTKRLPVSGAFHTKLMASACEPVKDVLQTVTLNDPEIPVYSNVTASRFRQKKKMAELLQQQVTSPVKWEQIMHVMYSRPQGEEFPSSYEVGPGNQLGTMLKMVNLKAYDKYTQVQV